MPKGGARIRSGPPPDPNSARSEQRGYSLTALPAEGYKGKYPAFPLPDVTNRESQVWRELWRTPQACAWSLPAESWRHRTIALYCRLVVRCEAEDVPASLLAQLHRFADQIGLTTAGLALMGWKVAEDEVAAKARQHAPAAKAPAPSRRLRAVPGA